MSPKTQKATPPKSGKAKALPQDAVKVTAVNSTSGRAATTIHVEVDHDKVRQSLDGFDEVDEVLAQIPEPEEGKDSVRWSEAKLQREKQGPGSSVHFSGTHYGPAETTRFGVGVKVKAKSAHTLEAKGLEGAVSLRETDKPEPEKKPRKPARRTRRG